MNSKKIFLPIILLYLLSIIFVPLLAKAAIVTCDGPNCTIDKFFEMLGNIYSFIVQIATPLAVIALTVGGILMMISAGNPNLMSIGKKVFWSAVIGLALVLATKAIINFILSAMGSSQTV
jgi:hypothetical protein